MPNSSKKTPPEEATAQPLPKQASSERQPDRTSPTAGQNDENELRLSFSSLLSRYSNYGTDDDNALRLRTQTLGEMLRLLDFDEEEITLKLEEAGLSRTEAEALIPALVDMVMSDNARRLVTAAPLQRSFSISDSLAKLIFKIVQISKTFEDTSAAFEIAQDDRSVTGKFAQRSGNYPRFSDRDASKCPTAESFLLLAYEDRLGVEGDLDQSTLRKLDGPLMDALNLEFRGERRAELRALLPTKSERLDQKLQAAMGYIPQGEERRRALTSLSRGHRIGARKISR